VEEEYMRGRRRSMKEGGQRKDERAQGGIIDEAMH